MNQRNSNFELLRVISILLILLMHISSMTNNTEFLSLNFFVKQFISSIGNIGVTLFVLISGYFGVKFKPNKFVYLVYLTTFYAVIVYILNSSLPINHFSNIDFIKSLFIVPLYKNWFITCYLILMILAPFVDSLISRMDKRNFKKMIILLFILFSMLPTLFNTPYYTVITSGGKSLTYFMFIYLIGRYLKINKDVLFQQKWTFLIFVISTFFINVFNNTASYILNKSVGIYAMDCSPLILISSISVFYFFKSMKLKSEIINYISSSIIAVYLLDESRIFLDYYTFKINNYSNSTYLFLVVLTEVILFFIVAIVLDKIRLLLFNKLETNVIERLITVKIRRINLFK